MWIQFIFQSCISFQSSERFTLCHRSDSLSHLSEWFSIFFPCCVENQLCLCLIRDAEKWGAYMRLHRAVWNSVTLYMLMFEFSMSKRNSRISESMRSFTSPRSSLDFGIFQFFSSHRDFSFWCALCLMPLKKFSAFFVINSTLHPFISSRCSSSQSSSSSSSCYQSGSVSLPPSSHFCIFPWCEMNSFSFALFLLLDILGRMRWKSDYNEIDIFVLRRGRLD